jgi:uncharacterized protein YndB with AHSA1/START domain
MSESKLITVQTKINAPLETVWELWTNPEHIKKWNNASDDWHTPHAQNDVQTGGKFLIRMEAKDQSVGFDFGGTYTKVIDLKQLEYTMDDGRTIRVQFEESDGSTHIAESFEAETENSIEMQQQGWQAILENFKQYVEIQPLE